mgnify:CR=1 FL=1
MLDDITANKYNIILSIILGLSSALFINYLINRERIVVIEAPPKK